MLQFLGTTASIYCPDAAIICPKVDILLAIFILMLTICNIMQIICKLDITIPSLKHTETAIYVSKKQHSFKEDYTTNV